MKASVRSTCCRASSSVIGAGFVAILCVSYSRFRPRWLSSFIGKLVEDVGQLYARFINDLINFAPLMQITPSNARRDAAHRRQRNADGFVHNHFRFFKLDRLPLFLTHPNLFRAVFALTKSASALVRAERRSGSRSQRR